MLTLVTGSTGLLGNNVVRTLLDRGESVRVLLRASSPAKPLQHLDVERSVGDLSDEQFLRNSMVGVDRVVHSAGFVKIGWADLETARRVNVEGTRALARAALEKSIPMVHVSTVNTLGLGKPEQPADEDTPPVDHVKCAYVVSKNEAEEEIQRLVAEGLQASIVNPGFMLGPWDWKPSSGQMLVEVATRFTPAAPPGGCSVVDVRDVAHGICLALEKGQPGRRYVLAGDNMSYFDLWNKMAEVSGGKGPVAKLGPAIRWIAGTSGDLWGRITRREPLINSAAVRMGAQFHYYSSKRAIDELGYQMRPSIEAIQAAWGWFQEHEYVGSREK